MLSKITIFAFTFLGIFALMMGLMPSAFMEHQAAWNPSYHHTDENVVSYFNANNITIYDSSESGNLTFPDHQYITSGLPPDQKIDIAWDDYFMGIPYFQKSLWLSHQTVHTVGPIQWTTHDELTYYTKQGLKLSSFIHKDDLETYYDENMNGTLFYAHCDQIYLSILYTTNYTTIGQGWDNGLLGYMLSYEFNASSTALNMWAILGQLLTFQSPNLGIPDPMGEILNALIAIPLSIIIIIALYKVISGLVPFLSGGSGD